MRTLPSTLTIKLYRNDGSHEEITINKDHVVTVRSYVDILTDFKVVEIVTLASVIKIIFYGYNRDKDINLSIDLDARYIVDCLLREADDNSCTYDLRSNSANDVDIRTTLR